MSKEIKSGPVTQPQFYKDRNSSETKLLKK